MKKNIKKLSLILLPLTGFFACSPPRSIVDSGKVVTKNQIRFGNNYSVNVSTSPIQETIKGVEEFSQMGNKDSFEFNQGLEHLNAAALAYSLDPIGYKTDLYLRYGLGHNIDVGYRYSGKSHLVDARYQFLGSNSTYQYSEHKGINGSVGVQYGWQNYGFNDRKFDQLKRIFDMSMSRKDISVPLIFSKDFGAEEKFGAISMGLIYTHSFVKYNINPVNVYLKDNEGVQRAMEPLNVKKHYGAYGATMNLKAGYKFIYFNVGLAAYYQKYGTFPLLGGNNVTLKGWTFVPSYGLQFNLYPRKKNTSYRNM
ncbi:MAG: hypothetical protein K0Q95_2358 [Bacteroidota bacterium]|jgi:hypothetical protein|nr:hypothetical protein [Bacteroidota bacterium]